METTLKICQTQCYTYDVLNRISVQYYVFTSTTSYCIFKNKNDTIMKRENLIKPIGAWRLTSWNAPNSYSECRTLVCGWVGVEAVCGNPFQSLVNYCLGVIFTYNNSRAYTMHNIKPEATADAVLVRLQKFPVIAYYWIIARLSRRKSSLQYRRWWCEVYVCRYYCAHFIVAGSLERTRTGPVFIVTEPCRQEITRNFWPLGEGFRGVRCKLLRQPHIIDKRLRNDASV